MAQLPDEENYNPMDQIGMDYIHDTTDPAKPGKNRFQCSYCDNRHDIGDVFLWSGCQHQYGRGCVLFTIRQQLYDEKIPLCVVADCNKMLLEEAAQLILPEDILIRFYNMHNAAHSYDEKTQYQSLRPADAIDSSSDGMADITGQILGTIDPDPEDESSEAEITYRDEQQPLLSNGQYGTRYGIRSNMDSKQRMAFNCVLCKDRHLNEDRFEWTQCKHLYGRQCAENMIIDMLFKQDIAQCIECKKRLSIYDAHQILHYDEMQVFKEIYTLKQSMESYNADVTQKQIVDGVISDQTEKVCITQHKEHKDEDGSVNKSPLMPSVLVLPDNNYGALIPMDDDFLDEYGMVLSATKEQELSNNNLFYCSQCKQLISLIEDIDNGKFIALKCEHVTCSTCAKQHIEHTIHVLKHIPSCPVCPESITDADMIAVYGERQAKQYMDELFKETSLQIPPYAPAVAVLETPSRTEAGNVDDGDMNDRGQIIEDVVEIQNVEHKEHVEEVKEEDNTWGHCLTQSCHKKGRLSIEKNEETRLDCDQCGVSWCVRCGAQWHLGQTCTQYQVDVASGIGHIQMNDDMSILYALQEQEQMQFDGYDDIMISGDESTKLCPKCGRYISKDGGCNMIICTCGVQFCWMCNTVIESMAGHFDVGKCQLN